MTFSDAVRRWTDDRARRLDQAASIAVLEVWNSVRDGSAVTGSLGTPVDTGTALNSWAIDGVAGDAGTAVAAATRAGEVRTIVGGVVYLRGLEEGRARRKPPGWVRLTVAQWPAVRAYALRLVGLAP